MGHVTETQTSTWADFHARKRLLMALSLLGPIVALVVASGYVETHGRMGLAWPLLAWAAATVYAGVPLSALPAALLPSQPATARATGQAVRELFATQGLSQRRK